MKKILTLPFLLLLTTSLFSQELPVDAKTGKITYIEVVDATGLSSKELYQAMKEWAKENGLKMKEDKEAEQEMIFEEAIPVEYARIKGKNEMSEVSDLVYLMAKDNKYRYIFTDFVHEGSEKGLSGGKLENKTPECGYSGINAANWNVIKKKTASEMDAKVTSLKKRIKEIQNDPARNKDW